MSRMPLGMLLAATVSLGGWWSPQTQAPGGGVQDSTGIGDPIAPAPWIRGDPADSLYRAAREALDRRDYRRAADLFGEISTKYSSSGYAADALYWRAFALYRLGSTS
jgi:TolA-binding protein